MFYFHTVWNMTDGTQQQDPTQQQTSGDDVFSGIFGGSETIFENPDMFKSIEPEGKKQEKEGFIVPKEIEEHIEEIPLNINPVIKEEPVVEEYSPVDEDAFRFEEETIPEEEVVEDPFILEETIPEKEEIIQSKIEASPEIEEEIVEEILPEEKFEEEIIEEEQTPEEEEIVEEEETVNYPEGASGLMIDFYDLLSAVKRFESLSEFAEHKELLGGNTDSIKLIYELQSEGETVIAYRKEFNKQTSEETMHTMTLQTNEAKDSLQVLLNDEPLYDEKEDLADNPSKKMQVSEKINKFIFLLKEATKDLEKKKKEAEGNKEHKKILQNVFRNF